MANELPSGVVSPVDPFDPKILTLGGLFKPVLQGSTKPTQENRFPPYDALQVPESQEGRGLLNGRMLDLFIASSKGTFADDQLRGIKAALQEAMPDPERDPENFTRFVHDRCHGVLEMLRLLVVMQSKKPAGEGDVRYPFYKDEVSEEAGRFGVHGLSAETGAPVPVANLIGKARDTEMHPRVERIRAILEIGSKRKMSDYNKGLMPAVAKKFAGSGDLLGRLNEAFTSGAKRVLKNDHSLTEDYTTPQWFAVLNTKLSGFDMSRTDKEAQFGRLEKGLQEAQDSKVFRAAIDTFGGPIP